MTCIGDEWNFPKELRFVVRRHVRALNGDVAQSFPVKGEVVFESVGKRLYGAGRLLSVEQQGEPIVYEPEYDGEFYGMSED